MKKEKVTKKSPRIKLFILETFVVIIIAVGLYIYLQSGHTQNYHQLVSQALKNDVSYSKQLVDEIHFSGNKIADEGEDHGCRVTTPSEFDNPPFYLICTYNYYVYFLGSGNPQKDLAVLYDHIKQAGWEFQEASGDRYVEFQNDSSYDGFPIGLSRSDIPKNIFLVSLNLNVINHSNYDTDFYPGNVYKKLMSHYVTNNSSYIYGYEIQTTYVHTICNGCKLGAASDDY